jgi:putative nucleotidyltransferase with HDIG domain
MGILKREKGRFSYRDLLYKALIFAGTVAVIVYFLPRDSQFNYQFDVNKPWKYGQLIATFDFPIYKDEQTVKREQDSIRTSLLPYFRQDKQVTLDAVEKLKENYRLRLHTLLPSTDYLHYMEKRLNEIYAAGIMSNEDLKRLQDEGSSGIMVIDDKLAVSEELAKVYSAKNAYTYLLMGDSVRVFPYILQQCSLTDYLSPNLIYDKARTESAQTDAMNNYSWAKGIVQSGQKIIDRGEIVNRNTYNILESLKSESAKRSETIGQMHLILIGQILLVCVLMFCFMLYLELYRKEFYEHKGSLSLLFLLIILYTVLTSLMISRHIPYIYIIPYTILPIVLRVFLDSRTAFTTHIIMVLLCSICLSDSHEFILLQTAAGLVAIYSLRELSQRSQLFRTAFWITLTYVVVHLSIELINENDLSKLNGSMYAYFLINGALLLFTYPLLFLLEKTFGFTSNVTLVELSNINNPLLRRMSETVPGTFQHSMQVANLAAEAANRIGAKSQLVRTGALYHDIGKMENPIFFTENQSAGVNPHKNLTYEQSAQIIIKHVTDGLKLAEKNNLPTVIKDFISTHHGKGKVKYFYISWKNEHPGEEPDETLFTYPGPNPFTRETAILMMADAVEATSRSLQEYTEESINALVDKIIDTQVSEGFFRECPITFKDIATIKTVFKEKLKTIYHTRISYPELKKEASEVN